MKMIASAKLLAGVKRNFPDAVPDVDAKQGIFRSGGIYTSIPVAFAADVPAAMQDAIEFMGAKLTHALYHREVRRVLTDRHRFVAAIFQPQTEGTDILTNYFCNLLPELAIGDRPNIKIYGDRFRYISGYKEAEDFFVYAAQFGRGCILWGIVCGPNLPDPNIGPGGSLEPKFAGCGPGRASSASIAQ